MIRQKWLVCKYQASVKILRLHFGQHIGQYVLYKEIILKHMDSEVLSTLYLRTVFKIAIFVHE